MKKMTKALSLFLGGADAGPAFGRMRRCYFLCAGIF